MLSKTNGLKRVVSFSVAALCMLSAVKFAPFNTIETNAADSITAFEITEDMKIGWNLGNSLDATGGAGYSGLDTEISWGNPKATQEMINTVKAKGFNTLRIPTTWYPHLDENNNIDPAWLARVHEVVDYAYKNDMYVILNVHHENWVNRADLGTAYEEMSVKLKAIWKQLAEEFKDYDQHLVFEGMNEPRAAGTDHEWWGPKQEEVDCINKLNQDFVDTVRSVESPYKDTRLLMVPPYCATSDAAMMSTLKVPDDPYVAASIHAYSPYGFTMDKEVPDHSTFTEAYATELETILNGIRKQFIEKDIPVVLGEFSASNYDNTEARCEWANKYISLMKGYGIPCVLWDNDARGNSDKSEAHDYLDRDNLVWYEDSGQVIDVMMKVLADDSIKWGSQKYGKQYNHEDITKGNIITSKTYSIDASIKDGNCTEGLNATWKDLEGKDVAIKFTGDVPIVAVVDGAWDGWTEIQAYDVDEKNGIAYYSSDTIKAAWSGDVSKIEHLFARTNGKTTIEMISIINGSEIIDPPIETTKKFDLDLSTRSDSEQVLYVTFEGAPGSVIQGCIGYMGEEWTNIEFDDKIGADGKFSVQIGLSGKGESGENSIPAGVTSAQAQIWWCDDSEATMTKYEIFGLGVPKIFIGDTNEDGEVNLADAVLIMQYIANPSKYKLTEQGMINGDVDETGDGITPNDAFKIQQFVLGIITTLEPTDTPD